MGKNRYLLLLGTSAALGAALGTLSDPDRPVRNGVFGAIAGLAAGSLLDSIYEHINGADDGIELYSASSPLYEDDDVGYI